MTSLPLFNCLLEHNINVLFWQIKINHLHVLWLEGATLKQYMYCTSIYAAKLPLSVVRQLYFRLKNKVFAKARFGVVYSAQELEKILKEVFGDMTMDQVYKPK